MTQKLKPYKIVLTIQKQYYMYPWRIRKSQYALQHTQCLKSLLLAQQNANSKQMESTVN